MIVIPRSLIDSSKKTNRAFLFPIPDLISIIIIKSIKNYTWDNMDMVVLSFEFWCDFCFSFYLMFNFQELKLHWPTLFDGSGVLFHTSTKMSCHIIGPKQYLIPIPLSVEFSIFFILIQPPSLAASVLVEAKLTFRLKNSILLPFYGGIVICNTTFIHFIIPTLYPLS